MSPPTSLGTGRRNARLTTLVGAYAERHGYVHGDSSTGVRLPNGDMLLSDALLLTEAQWEGLSEPEREGLPEVVPIVVVELRSKSDRLTVITAKCDGSDAPTGRAPLSGTNAPFGRRSRARTRERLRKCRCDKARRL